MVILPIFLILPIVAAVVAQISKFFIKSNRLKFKFRHMIAYSGMPSGHSAMVISLLTIIGLKTGITSAAFALSFFFALITIRDALGLRRQIGKQGEVINDLVEDLDEDELLDDKYPKLLEKIGHTKAQALVGSIIGFLVSLIGYYLTK
jgi:uncharacterized protein